MLFDQEFLGEHAVSPLPQDYGKYALYMLYHNNIEYFCLFNITFTQRSSIV